MLKKILLILAVILVSIFFLSRSIQHKDYSVDSFNYLSYPEGHGRLVMESSLIESNSNYTVEKVIYDSKNQKIYGLLYVPKSNDKVPALVYLPAAGARKEALSNIVLGISSKGYAVLVIDQRGIGETGGKVPDFNEDYQQYQKGDEPVSFKIIYDALKAFDVLYNDKRVDNNKIIFTGESMGARTAIIASALEKRSRGAIVFSTSGFNAQDPFISIIDADNYVSSLNRFVLFHSEHDSVIPFENAKLTFSKAKEPKKLILMPRPCDHGWCSVVESDFLEELGKF